MVEVSISLALFVTLLGAAYLFFSLRKKVEERGTQTLKLAIEEGQRTPPSLHPVIDPSLCVGSFSCIRACPEGEIIGIVDGVATLVQAAHCIGHATCADECPVGAIKLVYGVAERGVDLPEVDDSFASSRAGVYIVGELGGMGLIKNALRQGLLVGKVIKDKLKTNARAPGIQVDVVVVGGGPAGIATAIACRRQRLSVRVFEQESLGGAIAHYPRGKVVMTEQIEMPNYGPFGRALLSKEELMSELHELVKKNKVTIEEGMKVLRITGDAPSFQVTTSSGAPVTCRAVVLAIGLRGTPRKLDVPGEELPKVTYRLVDPEQYHGRAVLVVGGGDSAVEAAIQLAEASTARVSISYRGKSFSRCKPRNRDKIKALIEAGQVTALFETRVHAIEGHHVTLAPAIEDKDGKGREARRPQPTAPVATRSVDVDLPALAAAAGSPATVVEVSPFAAIAAGDTEDRRTRVSSSITVHGGVRALDKLRTAASLPGLRARRPRTSSLSASVSGSRSGSRSNSHKEQNHTRIDNNDVIVSIGGELPTDFLQSIGVTSRRYFGEERAATSGPGGKMTKAEVEARTRRRLAATLFAIGSAIIAGLLLIGGEYYSLPEDDRLSSPMHAMLRPSGLWGHGVGMVATTFMLANFIYAARKRWRVLKSKGSIRTWLTFHMFVGIMSPLVIAFHSAFLANSMLAIWTWVSLSVVVTTGVFGRFLFGLVPMQTGRMLGVNDLHEQVNDLTAALQPGAQPVTNVAAVTQLFNIANHPPRERTVMGAFLREGTERKMLIKEIDQARTYFKDEGAFTTFREALLRLARARIQISFYATIKRVFRGWLIIHIILAVFMVLLIGAHIAVAAYLGFGEFFVGQAA